MMRFERGFTLIEILVVVVIISITIGIAMLAFGDFGSERRIVMAGEQFLNYLKFVQHEAIIETATLGICLENNSYRVMRLTENSVWINAPRLRVFMPHHFPTDSIFTLNTALKVHHCPQIVIDSAGDISSFAISLGNATKSKLVTIKGSHDQDLFIERPAP